ARMQQGTYDPHTLPSALIGKEIPVFDLPALAFSGQRAVGRFTSRDIIMSSRPALVNFFASWCEPCAEEATALMDLKAQNVPIFGIAYKDAVSAAGRFLEERGNPYIGVGSDLAGSVGIDFGLYGVPETYALDARGIVRRRWSGPVTGETAHNSLLPLLKSLA